MGRYARSASPHPNSVAHLKSDLGCRVSDVYSILSECSKVYLAQTGHTIKLYQPGKLEVAKPSSKKEHLINFKDTIAIQLHPDDRAIGFASSPNHDHNMKELKEPLLRKGQ
jgi:hypothetical protein